MGTVVVNTNTQSIFAQRALRINTMNLQKNLEHLSTGFRINTAADDAAGLSISEKMTSRINGFSKAKQNAADGISLIQTAEGGLSTVQENLQRIRELFVQGINGTYSSTERDALQREINERLIVINDVAKSVQFNGVNLLKNGSVNIVLQTGSDDTQLTTLSFITGATANTGIKIDITAAVSTTALNNAGQIIEGVTTTGGFSLSQIKINGATVSSVGEISFGLSGAATIATAGGGWTLSDLDAVINNVSRMRSQLGAIQNALESKITFLDIAVENAASARSRIKDVDVAEESSRLTSNQILQQSASTMLAQANSSPQIALQLLRGGG